VNDGTEHVLNMVGYISNCLLPQEASMQ
jgi:hypothetical protein